jgi:hypothetical protein
MFGRRQGSCVIKGRVYFYSRSVIKKYVCFYYRAFHFELAWMTGVTGSGSGLGQQGTLGIISVPHLKQVSSQQAMCPQRCYCVDATRTNSSDLVYVLILYDHAREQQ